jgi:hypothetical protein
VSGEYGNGAPEVPADVRTRIRNVFEEDGVIPVRFELVLRRANNLATSDRGNSSPGRLNTAGSQTESDQAFSTWCTGTGIQRSSLFSWLRVAAIA